VPSAQAVARSLAIELVPSPVENTADIERVIAGFAGIPNGGLLVLPSGTTSLHSDLVIRLAARYRLPAVYPFRFSALPALCMKASEPEVAAVPASCA
jgi:putative ABC transport system substrate-binding protein